MSRRAATQLFAAAVLVVLTLVAAWLPVPYLMLSAGPTFNTLGAQDGKPLIKVEGHQTYPTDGRLDLTTVSERGGPRSRLDLLQAVKGWLDPKVAVVPRRLFYPDNQTAEQVQRQNAEDMTLSQENAVAAAMKELSIPTTPLVVVRSVAEGAPALGKLRAGDEILTVDGKSVTTAEQVRDAVRAVPSGTKVTFTVNRAGKQVKVDVTTAPSPTDKSVSYVGITPDVIQKPPFAVDLQIDNVGGPSAGLMFSLGIVDKLTPEQETSGRFIAGTGTIDADGKVGPIGGIQQKLIGAKDAGAKVFLSPRSNCAEALPALPLGLSLVPVDSLHDALTVLQKVKNGSALPTCGT